METEEISIVDQLINEVKSYLPTMKEFLHALGQDSADKHASEEMYRLTHTISGASSMVGMTDLSQSAQILEHIVSDALAGNRTWNSELIDAVSLVIDTFAGYFASLPDDGSKGRALLAKTCDLMQPFQEDNQKDNEPAAENDISLEEMLFAGSDDETDSHEDFLEDVFGDQEDPDDLPGFDSLFTEDENFDVGEGATPLLDIEAQEKKQEHSSDVADIPHDFPDNEATGAEPAPEPSRSPFELEMQESFQEEAAEHLSKLYTELNVLEGEITEPSAITDMLRKRLHVIRRSVHTLKGAAAVVGIKPVAAWGHLFEDFLDWLHDDAHGVNPDIIAAMIDGTELLETLVEDSSFDADPVANKLQARFQKIMDEDAPEPAAAKAPLPPVDAVSPQEAPEGTDAPAESVAAAPQLSPFELEMRESFQEEAAEHLSKLYTELNVLEGEITEPSAITDMLRKRLHVIRRSVHTLKGAAAVVGIKPVAAWGHSFEDFLDWLHDDAHGINPDIIAAMIDGTDLLETLVEDSSFDADPAAKKLQVRFQKIMDEDAPVSEAGKAVATVKPRAAVSTIDAGLEQSFDIESEEYLEGMGRQLNLLTTIILEPTVIDKELYRKLDTIRKAAHGLRGASGVVGHIAMMQWAEEVELFLDWLLFSAEPLTPEIVTALVDATIILEKYCDNPNSDQNTGQQKIRKIFSAIQQHAGSNSDAAKPTPAAPIQRPATMPARKLVRSKRQKPAESAKKKAMIRVGGDKLERISGLGGDLSINLGSFEDADSSMQTVFDDLAMIRQRLKGISSSLEAGYELATIPHFGGMGGGSAQADGALDEFDPLEMDRYSELNILIRSMQEAVRDMESIMEQGGEIRQTWRQAVDRQSKLVTEVQTAVQSIQMTPFSTLANRLYRTVREASRATGKRVRLAIDGGSIEMDTHVWDVLADPLMHMLRNAVDHGIEDLETRQNAGKTGQAEIRITCGRKGSRFILRLADDGSGLDYEAIRAKAQKLYPDMDTAAMDHAQLGGLIFRQGFSVRTKVSDISGRGVGMDVVRDAVEQLNGTVEVKSIQGKGVEFILSIPIIVAMLPALLVSFAKQVFALPMRDVSRIIRIPGEKTAEQELLVDDEKLQIFRPAEIFQLQDVQRKNAEPSEESCLGVIVETADSKNVLIVDQILGQKEVVFKNLSWPLDGIPFVTGATIMGDGSLVPILNVEDLTAVDVAATAQIAVVKEEKEDDNLTILFADDSISIRKVLEKFISYYGWIPVAAHDGVDAMEKVRDNRADLIILDVEMPRMNGFEVLRALKAQDEYRDIPVLMLTSRAAGKYREKAANLGAVGFVTKPFKDQDLRELILSLTKQ